MRVKLNSWHWKNNALFKMGRSFEFFKLILGIEFCARVSHGLWAGLDNISELFIWLLYLPILFFVL